MALIEDEQRRNLSFSHKRMISKLINIGVTEALSLQQVKRVKLLNQMALIYIAVVGVKWINELIVVDLVGFSITSFLMSLFGVNLLLNHLEKYELCKLYFVGVNAFVLIFINIIFGRGFGSEFLIFPLIIVIILFFDSNKLKIIWMGIFGACYLGTQLFLSYNEPLLIENLSPSSFYFTLTAAAIGIFILSNLFVSENTLFGKKMIGLLSAVQGKNKELETANKELERFTFVASHDLKTPLRNINSFLQLIERGLEKGEINDLPEYLKYARTNAERMHNLIEDVLEFSRLKLENVSFKKIGLNVIVDEAMSNLQDIIESKNAKVIVDELPIIDCIEYQMVSLFQNLIENGIKYNDSEIPRINIRFKKDTNNYIILIEDNGIGIQPEYRDKIFDMFYRLHTVDKYSGTGIGLATSKKVVNHHNGQLKIESSNIKGTVFSIQLPIKTSYHKIEKLESEEISIHSN